jgi:hypothetical protein
VDAAGRLALRAYRAESTPENAAALVAALDRAGALDPAGPQPGGGRLRITHPMGANATEVEIGSGLCLFSYRTLVAFRPYGATSPCYVTDAPEASSRTTRKHIGQWRPHFHAPRVVTIPAADLDAAVSGDLPVPEPKDVAQRWAEVCVELGQLADPLDGPARSTRLAAWELARSALAELTGNDPTHDLRHAVARLPDFEDDTTRAAGRTRRKGK